MRSFKLVFIYICFYAHSFGQAEKSIESCKIRDTYLNLTQELYDGGDKFKFSSLYVIDARADTGKIGYWNINEPFERINFENGTKSGLEKYVSAYFKNCFSSDKYTVLMVIRKLWFSQFDTITNLKTVGGVRTGRAGFAKLKLDFYLQKEASFYPITRVDSTWYSEDKNAKKNIGNILAEGVSFCCYRLFSLNPDELVKTRRKLSLTEIESHNNKMFDVPIIKATQYKRGIFMSFSEFLNNTPTKDYLSIDQDKFGDVLFVKDEKGKEYATNNVWGFSDGNNIFITSGKNFYKLIRSQNTFEFLGIKNVLERFNYKYVYTNPNGESPQMMHKIKPQMRLFPYQVDMETGEIY